VRAGACQLTFRTLRAPRSPELTPDFARHCTPPAHSSVTVQNACGCDRISFADEHYRVTEAVVFGAGRALQVTRSREPIDQQGRSGCPPDARLGVVYRANTEVLDYLLQLGKGKHGAASGQCPRECTLNRFAVSRRCQHEVARVPKGRDDDRTGARRDGSIRDSERQSKPTARSSGGIAAPDCPAQHRTPRTCSYRRDPAPAVRTKDSQCAARVNSRR
jgi:hypothetical protein